MSLLDLLVIALTFVACRFIPQLAFWGVLFTVVLALIIERLLKGERIT